MMSDICVQFVETERTKSFKKWLVCGDQHLKWKSEMQCNVNNILFLSSAIGRTLIPRYFSTVFEGGVSDLYYILKHSKESFHNSCITVDCDQCTMVTQHGKPMFTKVKRERECVWKEKWQLSVSFSSYIPCDKPCKLLIEQTNMAGLIIYYVIHIAIILCVYCWMSFGILIKYFRRLWTLLRKLFINLLLSTHSVCCHIRLILISFIVMVKQNIIKSSWWDFIFISLNALKQGHKSKYNRILLHSKGEIKLQVMVIC